MTDPTTNGYRRLACAVIRHAVLDAQSANGRASEARRWLESDPFCHFLLDSLDIAPEAVTAWLRDLPEVAQLALPLWE
jgi:hypothetical protein